jgi:hypothetical protein
LSKTPTKNHRKSPRALSLEVLTDESVVGPYVYGAVRFVLRLSVTDPLEVGPYILSFSCMYARLVIPSKVLRRRTGMTVTVSPR